MSTCIVEDDGSYTYGYQGRNDVEFDILLHEEHFRHAARLGGPGDAARTARHATLCGFRDTTRPADYPLPWSTVRARLKRPQAAEPIQGAAPDAPTAEPPAMAEFLLRMITPQAQQDCVVGDAREVFNRNFLRDGRRVAVALYCSELVKSAAPLMWVMTRRVLRLSATVALIRRMFAG